MSLKKIDAAIRSFSTNVSKLNDQVHNIGLMILAHAQEHGDCTRALVIVKAMPASMRRTMLVDWFARFSPIRVVLTNDKVGMLKADAKGYVAFDIEAATAQPFYLEQTKVGSTETKAFTTQSFDDGFAAYIKRVEKQLKDGNVPEADRPGIEARLAVLSAMVTHVEASKASVSFKLPTEPVSLNPRERAAA